MLFDQFTSQDVEVGGARIHCRMGGTGPPLLLLHGCPQTHVMWHKVAPSLARHFTVVASDLRGYGDSSKPRGSPDHQNYSFRAMAADQRELMSRLGHEHFSAVGHDRGARVLHRMALDRPDALARLALLVRALSDPTAMHGMCEDYRAGASIGLEHDAADSNRRIGCPLTVLWGDENLIWQRFEVLDVWRQFATSVVVVGTSIGAGHYLAEEAPEQVLSQLLPFLPQSSA